MGFLDRLQAESKNEIHPQWKILSSLQELDHILANPQEKPIVFFKHSIRCGTSSYAKHRLEEGWDLDDADLDFYYLDLINHREVSNAIAQRTGVTHQSPQIIVIKAGTPVFNMSHHQISIEELNNGLKG